MDSRIKKLFERYESGEAGSEERKLVEAWFGSFENSKEPELSDEQKSALFGHLDAQIQGIAKKGKIRKFNTRLLLRVAAMILVVLTIGLLTYRSSFKKQIPVTYSVFTARNGEKKNFVLPDGTMVALNSGSIIRIPSNFGEESREISLTGEAFFDVVHNPAKPFTINAGKLVITDIGTSFDVSAYPEDKGIAVSVATGSVSAERNDGVKKISSGPIIHNQQWIYDNAGGTSALKDIQTKNLAAWRQNRLRFENASFNEIAPLLERWYNVKVKLNNNSSCRRYTVSFNNDPIDKVLDVLHNLSGMSYQINKNNVVINLKNCKNL